MIYAISDLHLSLNGNKPMEVFGDNWQGYLDKIGQDWASKVTDQDVVLLAGDLSWAMRVSEIGADAQYVHQLPGRKIIIRGNHDYWWSSYNKIKEALPPDIIPLQNNAYRVDGYVICGSRGWTPTGEDGTDEDKKIWARELMRMQMALDDAHKQLQEDDKLIVMIHYPPFVGKFEPTAMTQLLSDYRVDTVVYGHIHGKTSFHKDEVVIQGVRYLLTSCDMIDHRLVKVY